MLDQVLDGILVEELAQILMDRCTAGLGKEFVTVQICPGTPHGHMMRPIDIVKVTTEVVEGEPAIVLELRP